MSKTIKASIEVITPAKAKKWLDAAERAGVANRKKNVHYIRLEADAMRAGKWKTNGESIKFDTNGLLMDGQHRLEACVLADTPFTTLVVRNVDRNTFDTIDCGKTRTCAQVLQMEQVPYHVIVASIITGRDSFKRNGNVEDVLKTVRSQQDLVAEYRRHPAEYVDAATVASRYAKAKVLTTKLMGTLYFHLVYDLGQDAKFVEGMLESITSLDTAKIPAFDKLRKLLYNYSTSDERVTDRLKMTQISMAWNSVVNGDKVPRFSKNDADTHDIHFDNMPLNLK